MSLVFTAIKAVLSGFFISLWDRLFPVKTADAEKSDVLEQEVKILNAEAVAKANAPTKMSELIAQQRRGEI